MSGTRTDRPQLAAAFEFAREGDVLVVARLDRLASACGRWFGYGYGGWAAD